MAGIITVKNKHYGNNNCSAVICYVNKLKSKDESENYVRRKFSRGKRGREERGERRGERGERGEGREGYVTPKA